jgi:hypothetical protein
MRKDAKVEVTSKSSRDNLSGRSWIMFHPGDMKEFLILDICECELF